MITIYEPPENVAKIISTAKIKKNVRYCLSHHVVVQKADAGTLLYHTLTCALLLLDETEEKLLSFLPCTLSEELHDLAAMRFLVPEDSDELSYCDQLKHILKMTANETDAITSYTIFTTSDCNARCFYCFELGKSRIPMSGETAKAAVDYITAHCKGKPVKLRWFGGEPLFNLPAIDTIVAGMNENGISYTSSMVSNGYLFDEALVKRAKDEWRLNKIQITLDGTEEIYNRRKAYIYREGSAYQRVIRNIGLLLESGIHVDIRLNLDMRNSADLTALVDKLAERFPNQKKLNVYNHVIFENPGESRSAEQRRALYQVSDALTEHIHKRGLGSQGGVLHNLRLNHCMADSDTAVTITPEGRLGRCEHYFENEEMFGSLRTDETDATVTADWKVTYLPFPECRDCFYYPRCFRLKKCPNSREYCDAEQREEHRKHIRRQMLNSYEKWKSKNPTEEHDDVNCEGEQENETEI